MLQDQFHYLHFYSCGNWGKGVKCLKVFVNLSCLTLCGPLDCSLLAPLSMAFCGQEFWSGLLVLSSGMEPGSSALQAESLPFEPPVKPSGLPCPPPGDLPNPGIEPGSPALQVDSLPSEPPGKPKNTGVGSTSLLQGNFPTQESNWGLLHCRRILYQLSYLGSQVSGPRLNNEKAMQLLFEFSSFRHQSPGTRTSLPAPSLPPVKASWQGQV